MDEQNDGALVLVHVFRDGYAADQFIELLKDEGITASTPGQAHRGMLGMVGTYVQIPVSVHPHDVERAQELFSLLNDSADEDENDEELERPRLRRIAFMAALFVPFGGGHMYARSHVSAWLLATLSIGGLITSWNIEGPAAAVLAFFPLAVVAYDLCTAPSAASRYNAKEPWSGAKQALVLLPSVLVLAFALSQLGAFMETLEVPEDAMEAAEEPY